MCPGRTKDRAQFKTRNNFLTIGRTAVPTNYSSWACYPNFKTLRDWTYQRKFWAKIIFFRAVINWVKMRNT